MAVMGVAEALAMVWAAWRGFRNKVLPEDASHTPRFLIVQASQNQALAPYVAGVEVKWSEVADCTSRCSSHNGVGSCSCSLRAFCRHITSRRQGGATTCSKMVAGKLRRTHPSQLQTIKPTGQPTPDFNNLRLRQRSLRQ